MVVGMVVIMMVAVVIMVVVAVMVMMMMTFVGLGLNPSRAWCMVDKYSTTELYSYPVIGFVLSYPFSSYPIARPLMRTRDSHWEVCTSSQTAPHSPLLEKYWDLFLWKLQLCYLSLDIKGEKLIVKDHRGGSGKLVKSHSLTVTLLLRRKGRERKEKGKKEGIREREKEKGENKTRK